MCGRPSCQNDTPKGKNPQLFKKNAKVGLAFAARGIRKVLGFDFSYSSLLRAELLCRQRRMHHVGFVCTNMEDLPLEHFRFILTH